MVLPKGKPVYTNLKTKVVKVDSLLEELSEEGFSGYVKLDFEDDEGVIFLDKGKVVGAYRKGDVKNALSELIKRGLSDKAGFISVYSLEPELLSVLSAVYSNEPVFKGVPFGIVDVERLLSWLAKSGFTGVLIVRDPAKEATFMSFFFSGDPFEFIYESIESSLIGEEAKEKIYEMNESDSAIFEIVEASLGEEVPSGNGSSGTAEINVISSVEEFFNAVLPDIWPHVGERGFKRAALKLAEDYPFLDPFDPDVYFKDGKIIIRGEVDPDELLKGMAALLREVVAIIPKDVRKLASASAAKLVRDSRAVEELFNALVGE